MNILLYLLILILGGIVGNKKILNSFFMERVGDIQNYALFLLLFIMGINIGVDEDVIRYFGLIGFQSVVLGGFSIIFSILAVRLIAKKVMVEKEVVENDR